MSWAFCGCSKLSFDITVSGNVKEYESCFWECATELNTQFRVRYNKNCSKELAQKIVDTKSETVSSFV